MFDQLYPVDVLIVLAYFGAVVAIGLRNRSENRTSEDFVTGKRQMPWGAVLASIVATEVSAATFLATPGVGFGENLNYLQFGIGSFFARLFIAFVFLGAFFSIRYITIYAFLGDRFGNGTRAIATLFFIVTRLLASAVRLMIATAGLHLILDVPFEACLTVFTVVAIIYTGSGGIRTVIWTDVLQAIVFISSGIVMIAYVGHSVGWQTIIDIGTEAGRFELFRISPDESGTAGLLDWLNDPNLLFIAVIFGFVSTAAAFGTDQDTTQRILTCKDVRAARRSVILSGFVSIPIAALFLVIGVSLFAFYQVHPDLPLPMKDGEVRADHVFSWFIRNELPVGLRGLLMTGVLAAAMSSLDSTMSALSSSSIVDLYRPLQKRLENDRHYLLLARVFVAVFGVALALIAWLLKDADGFLWLTFQIGSITYGSLLGVFLLGILTKRGSDRGNIIAMVSASVLCATLLALIRTDLLELGWTWLILIGTAWTFGLGWLMHEKAPPDTDGA